MEKRYSIWAVFIYGLLIAGFGFLGFVLTGSQASLWSSLVFGVLLVFSSALWYAGIRLGEYLALGTTSFLTLFFGIRTIMTKKMVPSLLAIFSAAMFLFLLVHYFQMRKKTEL